MPGVVVLRIEGGLFFANSDAVRNAIRHHAARPGTKAIVVDAETIPFIDVTAATMLAELTDDLERAGVRLVLAHEIGQVRDILRTATAKEANAVFPTVRAAVAAVESES